MTSFLVSDGWGQSPAVVLTIRPQQKRICFPALRCEEATWAVIGALTHLTRGRMLARRSSQTYPQGRNAAQAHHIWPGSWPRGCCRPLGSGGVAGLPRGWSHSEPPTRAGQSLSCRRAWGSRLACSLWPASAGVHQGLRGENSARLVTKRPIFSPLR